MNKIYKFYKFIFNKNEIENKVGFFVNEEYILDHYLKVIEKLDPTKFDIILANKFKNPKYRKLVEKLNLRWNTLFLSEVFHLKKYKVLVTNQFFGGNTNIPTNFLQRIFYVIHKIFLSIGIKFPFQPSTLYFQKILGLYNIRFMYGADTGGVKFGEYNYVFDEFFCHGPRDSEIVKEKFNKSIYEMGYPRYDSYFDKLSDEAFKLGLLKKYSCNLKKKTILWIVTVSEFFSTIETYKDYMTQFVKKYNIIVRPHPLEIDPQYDRYNPKVHKIILESDFIVSDDAYQNMSELYLIADYVFCDYGGTIFSALYLDKRILLMNHENVFKDLPVFGSTSMEVRNYLPSININETKSFFEDFSNENFWIDRENLRQEGRHYYFGNNKIDSAKKTANKILEILRNV